MKNLKLFEQYNQSHNRVIPRDFFNDSKLLKCMGFLALAELDNTTPDNITIELEQDGSQFDIQLSEMWNLLYVSNCTVLINDEPYLVGTTYNNKSAFPFYVVDEEESVEIEIFDDNGKFSDDFIEHFTNNED